MKCSLTLSRLAPLSFYQVLAIFFAGHVSCLAAEVPKIGDSLTDQQVSAFAKLALDGMDREYPYKPGNVLIDQKSVRPPRENHPAFYGCFDWHSSVHGHWMLVRLLKLYPNCSIGPRIREKLGEHLTKDNLQKEAAFFEIKENRSFERMYGWSWALRLAAELHIFDDPDAKQWRDAIRPLEDRIVELTKAYLPRLSHPIRTGVHPDTGFAVSQILDYAITVNDQELVQLLRQRSKDFYGSDQDYPARYEPSGEDFFSSCLNEADLMRRVLPKKEFAKWVDGFLPRLASGSPKSLLTPVEVTDVTDGKLVHLAGLNLSRAWTLNGIAYSLPKNDPRRRILSDAANAHAAAGFKYVFSGHYEGEHWLATFAIYVQSEVGVKER